MEAVCFPFEHRDLLVTNGLGIQLASSPETEIDLSFPVTREDKKFCKIFHEWPSHTNKTRTTFVNPIPIVGT